MVFIGGMGNWVARCNTTWFLSIINPIRNRDINALFVFSLWPTRNINKTYLRKIIFSISLNNLRVKSPITKKVKNNNFEGMTYWFYILLLFDFIFNLQHKQKKCCKFKWCLNSFETILRPINMSFSRKYYSLSFL